MALFKINDRYPDYQERFADGDNIIGIDVYVRAHDRDDKVGSIYTVLVDDPGRVRYLVVETGFWIFGKKVLLPIGRCIDDPTHNRIYAVGLTKEQVERLPEYRDELVVDDAYEEQVRSIYLMPDAGISTAVETSAPVERAGVEGYTTTPPAPVPTSTPKSFVVRQETDIYDRTSELYAMNDKNHQRLRLYEERLIADKHREKTGEVTVTKRIETEQAEASVGVQKEKIVIEVESVAGATRINTPDGSFQAGEVAQMDVYEEQANIRKEPVVRQEISIRKEVEEDIVTGHETLRREELDVRQEGSPDIRTSSSK